MPRLKRVPVEEEKPRTKTPNSESTGKKMGFFVDLLNLSHISYDNAAALAGMSKFCIYYWITVDNAKLSQVMNVIEGLGYSLRIILSRNEGDDAEITPRRHQRPPDVEQLQAETFELSYYRAGKICYQ